MNKGFRVFLKFIGFAYKCHKSYFYVVFFKAIVMTALAIFNVYSLSILIKSIETQNYEGSLVIGGIIVGVNLLFNFLNNLINRMVRVSKLATTEAVNRKITEKLMKVPYQYLEDPYYLDLKERAKFSIENQDSINQFLTSIAEIFQIVSTLIGLAAILITFDGILLVIILTAVLLNVIFILLSLKAQIKFYQDLIPINRRYSYYLSTIWDNKLGKDFRMYTVGKLMQNQFELYGKETVRYFKSLIGKQSFFSCIMQVVKYIEMGLVYGFVAIKTIQRHLSVSSFSLYISSALSFSLSMSKLIEVIMRFLQTITYLRPFIELVDLKEEKDEGKQISFTGDINSIEFKDVTFSYPKSNIEIMNNVSFKINKGEKISIVGLNGAGKTTLVKLLCRLYRPNCGEILVNGISIYDYEYESYIKQISAVFQDYKLFAYSIKENILNADRDDETAYEIAKKVGLKDKIDSLPHGINTLYSKIYDEEGVELSGGETQKIAIARALYKNSSLVILDEPTSALDPLAEAEIYTHFNELVLDKTAIYISHRMSSSVFCDRILILDQGKVVDFDTHENLLQKTDSLYYKLFMSQAKNYSIN